MVDGRAECLSLSFGPARGLLVPARAVAALERHVERVVKQTKRA